MKLTTSKNRFTAMLQGAMGIALLLCCFASPSFARGECGSFTATAFLNGQQVAELTTPTRVVYPGDQIPPGIIVHIRGTYVEFFIDLDTLTVFNYTLTGVPSPRQITTQRTTIFLSKVPVGARLTGDLSVELNESGQNLVFERNGAGGSVKIQAKDCNQGGIFQMEPEPARTETNTLANGFRYCYQANPGSRRFFTNGIVLGFDSPQTATLLSGTATSAEWFVQSGGRIGMVIGEDAVEALQLEGAAIGACPHQTPPD